MPGPRDSLFRRLEETEPMIGESKELTERLPRSCASRAISSGAARADFRRSSPAQADTTHAQDTVIAIVDDDHWAREGMNSFVASLGYLGAMFISAEDYLGSDLKQRAECLILDVHLCGMSGPDLQVRLIADGYCTPIIFVSAQFEDGVRDRVMKAGAFGYFTKPCDESSLINCLERAVGR